MNQTTNRPTVDKMELLLNQELPVLDHGFVRVVDYMGNDEAVVQAARVSYGSGTKSTREDRGLLRYLMRRWHTTPFEMCEIKLHVKLPIFVARQWVRHRTANVNEYSARYSITDREFFIPDGTSLAPQIMSNKQGREGSYSDNDQALLQDAIRHSAERSFTEYEGLVGGTYDLARETSRMVLPLNTYTQWYWKVDLHNLLHFLQLRADPHAQWEIRQYADIILSIVKQWVPNTYEALIDYRLQSQTFSKQGMDALRRLVAGETLEQVKETHGMSLTEWHEFRALFEGGDTQ